MSSVAHAPSSYVPRLLLQRLAERPPLVAPEGRRAPGVLLLSDIQGFTALVERFTSAGRDGLEELTWILNGYFADLVEVVHAHGGDVLSIAGDAFLCYWPVAGDDIRDAILRAAQCGQAIQERLHDRPAGRDHRFGTRIGVGSGDLVTAFVGGVGARWELVATGAALRSAIAAEQRAAAGQVVIAPAAWTTIAHSCVGVTGADGFGVLAAVREPVGVRAIAEPAPRESDDVLRPFLPPAVLDRLLLPRAEWLAESRRVTVLMASLPPLADAGATALGEAHDGVRAFQEVVERCEGTTKVDVDDKGILLLAVFGMPPRAHEDDAERAAYAAQQLRESLATLGIATGMGIATGRAICGAFGSDRRRDYMVRGEVINLAAR
ncbi:MAG: adenylate/guanylate cyclase domain-containing protein, partial [Gemmatimonadaceae bacterium]